MAPARTDPVGVALRSLGNVRRPALLQGVSVPLEWLREQDELAQQAARHEAALAALDQALAARRGAADLERLHREAARDGEVPPELEQSVRRRMAEIDRAARRRMWISVAAFAGFLLVLGGVITTVVMQHLEAAKADAALASLEQLVRDNNVDEARNFIDQLTAESPQIAADLRIQEIGSRLARQQRDEDGRRKAFATALELLRKSIDDKLPDNDALARAKKLAVSDDDKTTVRKAEQDIAKLGEAVQSKVDQDFLAELKEIKERVATAEKDLEDKPDAAVRKLNELGGELDHLLAAHPQISEAAKKPCELLRGRLKDLAQERIRSTTAPVAKRRSRPLWATMLLSASGCSTSPISFPTPVAPAVSARSPTRPRSGIGLHAGTMPCSR